MNRNLTCLLLLSLIPMTGCFGKRGTPVAPDEAVALEIRKLIAPGDGGPLITEIPTPVGFVDMTGTIRIQGTAPTLPPLQVTRDQNVCGAGSVPNPGLVVGANGALANVLVYLDDKKLFNKTNLANPAWVHPMYDVTKNPKLKTKLFDQKKCEFLNRVFTIRTSQQMIIKNSDPVGHNTALRPTSGASAFDQTIPSNAQVAHNVGKASPRPFPVSCAIHPWMGAWMITRDDPYFATTDATGSFKIEKIPAGAAAKDGEPAKPIIIPFRFWHEGNNIRKNMIVSAKVNRVDQKWNNSGKIKLKFEVGKPLNIEIVIAADTLK